MHMCVRYETSTIRCVLRVSPHTMMSMPTTTTHGKFMINIVSFEFLPNKLKMLPNYFGDYLSDRFPRKLFFKFFSLINTLLYILVNVVHIYKKILK